MCLFSFKEQHKPAKLADQEKRLQAKPDQKMSCLRCLFFKLSDSNNRTECFDSNMAMKYYPTCKYI